MVDYSKFFLPKDHAQREFIIKHELMHRLELLRHSVRNNTTDLFECGVDSQIRAEIVWLEAFIDVLERS